MKAILTHGGSYSVFNKIFHVGKPTSVTEEEWKYLSELKKPAGDKLFRSEGGEDETISYQDMSVDELRAKLADKGVTFRPSANKKALIGLLESHVASTGGDVAI